MNIPIGNRFDRYFDIKNINICIDPVLMTGHRKYYSVYVFRFDPYIFTDAIKAVIPYSDWYSRETKLSEYLRKSEGKN